MGGWSVGCFVNCVNTDLIQSALAEVFRQDGYSPCEKPSKSQCLKRGQKQIYESFILEPLWGISVLPCNKTGWSFLHCDPANLLCDRARNSLCPRLSTLATELNATAFQLIVEDSTSMVLLECTGKGKFWVSGDTYEAVSEGLVPPYRFFEETIHEMKVRFSCKDLKRFNSVLRSDSTMDAINEIGAALTGVTLGNYDEFSRNNGPFIKYEKFLLHKNKRNHEHWGLKSVVHDQIIANAFECFFRRR